MYTNDFEMYATQNESEEWNVKNTLIDGWNLNYVLEEETESNFELITNFQVLYEQNHKICIYYNFKKETTFMTKMKALRMNNSQIWRSQLAFLDSNQLGVDLYLSENNEKPNFNLIYHVMDYNSKCLDLDFIDDNTLIMGCVGVDQTVTLYLINTQGLILDEIPINLQFKENDKLIINSFNYQYNSFIMVTVPTYSDSQIIVLQIISSKIEEINEILDKELLSKLLDKRDLDFKLMDIQILNENIYLLDYILGVISLTFEGQWKQAKIQKHSVYSDSLYLAFYVNRQSYANIFGTQISILTQNNQNKYIFQTFNGAYILLQKQFDHVININNIQLYHFERDFLIYDNPTLYLVSGGLQYEFKESSNILGYPYTSKILVNSKKSIQKMNVGVTLYFKANLNSELMKIKSVKLSAYLDKQSTCNIVITYIIYKYNDGNLYKRFKSQEYNGVVYYPNYPEASLEQIELPQGPNIQGSFKLKSDSDLKIESKYFDFIHFGSISQEDGIVNNVMSAQSDDQIYFINQIGKIYECKMKQNYYNFICTYKASISHYNPANNNIVFQQQNDQLLNILAIMNTKNHQIDCYDIKSNGDSDLFMTITTKLSDENSVIQSFIIVDDNIMIAQPLKEQIQIYSITTQLILFTINQDWMPTKIFSKYKEMVYVVSQNYVYIFYIDYSYTLISKIQINDDINVEIEIVLLSQRFIVIYKGDNSQGISEYSIADITNIYLLKNIPLYSHLLQSPLIVKTKDTRGIFFIRAYDPISQQTVILYYNIQYSSMSRQYLYSSIPLGKYIPNGGNLKIYVCGNVNIYLFIITDTIILKLFVNNTFQAFLSPKISADQTYIMDAEIQSNFWNDYYPNRLNYNQQTQFVNLQSTILSDHNLFNSSELNITKIPQTFILDVQDNWFFGQILSYSLDCLQCGTNQESPIYLQNKIMPIKSNTFEGETIIDIIDYDSQLIILTMNNLYLLSSDTQLILNNIPLKKRYETYPIKLFVKESNKLVFVIYVKSLEVYGTSLNYFTLLAQTQFQEISVITDLIIIKDYFIIIDNSIAIRFYQFHQTQGQIIVDDCNLLLNYKDFAPRYLNFYQMQFKQKEINEYKLFISEITFGMICLDIQYETNNVFTLKKWELLQIKNKIIELGIQTKSYNIFQNIVFFDQGLLPKNIFKFIITNFQDASYIISIEFKDQNTDIQILRVINGYGTLYRCQRISLKNNILALGYYQSSKSDQVIIIYKVNEFNQDNLKENPIIAFAGVQVEKYQQDPIYILQHTEDNYNLIYVSQNSQIIQSQININAAIVIRDALEFQEEQPISLIAKNTFTQSQIDFKISVVTDHIENSTNILLWSIIIVTIIIILSILIFFVVKIRRKINKNKQKENVVIILN